MVMPDGFQPDGTAVQLAAELGLVLLDELAAFSDHHGAKGSRFADWQAALRNWLRNAAKYRQQAGRHVPVGQQRVQHQSFAQQDREAGWARWEEMTGRVHPDRIAAQQSRPVSGFVIDVSAPVAAGAVFPALEG